jgi:ParB-like chromosome segregation protein Spo0J
MKKNGLKEIIVTVVTDDEKKAKLNTIAANNIRGDMMIIKVAELLVELQGEYGKEYVMKMV